MIQEKGSKGKKSKSVPKKKEFEVKRMASKRSKSLADDSDTTELFDDKGSEYIMDEHMDMLGVNYDFIGQDFVRPIYTNINNIYQPRIFKKTVLRKFLLDILIEDYP